MTIDVHYENQKLYCNNNNLPMFASQRCSHINSWSFNKGNEGVLQTLGESLIEKYGGQKAFVAMGLLKGMTPGEILDAWGPNDAEILGAIDKVFNEPDEMALIMDEFDRARLSPGRNVARWVNKTFDISAEEHPDWFKIGSGSIDLAFQIFADPLTYLTV